MVAAHAVSFDIVATSAIGSRALCLVVACPIGIGAICVEAVRLDVVVVATLFVFAAKSLSVLAHHSSL